MVINGGHGSLAIGNDLHRPLSGPGEKWLVVRWSTGVSYGAESGVVFRNIFSFTMSPVPRGIKLSDCIKLC